MGRKPSVPSTGAADVAVLTATVEALKSQLAALTQQPATPAQVVGGSPVTPTGMFDLSPSKGGKVEGGLRRKRGETHGEFYRRRCEAQGKKPCPPGEWKVAQGRAVSIAASRLGGQDPFTTEKGALWKGIHSFLLAGAGYLPYYEVTPVPCTEQEVKDALVRLQQRRQLCK